MGGSVKGTRMYVFIHIPKTAGSSVNRTLRRSVGPGKDHVESMIRNQDFAGLTNNYRWISGHVTRAAFGKLLHGVDAKYFTFLREPTEQIVSHLRWQFAIFHKGKEFFSAHPVKNQQIALEAMAIDFSNAEQVIEFMRKYHQLFLNFQSKYILSDLQGEPTVKSVLKAAEAFSLIGTTDNIYNTLPRLLRVEVEAERENVAERPYFDEDIFRDRALAGFLGRDNARDQLLFDVVKNEIEPQLLHR